jgi:selenocysteine lyase/cysteine desulfurase
MLSTTCLAPVGKAAERSDDDFFAAWRARELSRLERSGLVYLDYTGAALYPESLVRADARRLRRSVLGNPHSEHGPSRQATGEVEAARAELLTFLGASPDEFAVIFTANASAACRLVGESFAFTERSTLALSADNHNSVNGIREFARARGARLASMGLDDDLRLRDATAVLDRISAGPSLFALPAQSNFSGVRHPPALVTAARERGWRVLLDAASYLGTGDLVLDQVRPDFLVLSMYKISGYPTGIGALVARHEALAELRRPWFAGGTVHWVSVRHGSHRFVPGVQGFEDGTPPFLEAGAIPLALDAVRNVGRDRLGRHLTELTGHLLDGIRTLPAGGGGVRVRVHGPTTIADRGATVAFTVRDAAGTVTPYWEVEDAARRSGLAVRGGCFCNPGCAESAFGFPATRTGRCLDELGDSFTVPRFAACLGGQPVGAIRASLGLGSVRADVDRLLAFLADGARLTE